MQARTRVKLCGMRTPDDVELAVETGADAIGAIVVPRSKRYVGARDLRAIAAAVPLFVTKVAVVGEETPDEMLALARELGFTLQLAGAWSTDALARAVDGRPYLRVVHVVPGGTIDEDEVALVARDPLATLMFDTKIDGATGGTGITFAWHAAEVFARRHRIVVAGGLNSENVGACVRAVRPFAVDVASGIETGGSKDARKMRAFVAAVRAADALV